jgi:hypothetical protein
MMKLTTKLLALSFVICSCASPLTALANNNQMQQMIIMNNVNTQEQTISNQINAYVGSGQLSPQQGAAFNSELSNISSQAMMGGANPLAVMSELNSFSAQINASLGIPGQYAQGQYVYGAATNPYGATPGYYNNWRANSYQDAAYTRNKELQAGRNLQTQENLMNNAARSNILQQERVNNTIQNERLHQTEAAVRHNTEVNNVKTNQVRDDRRTHEASPTR